MLQCINAKVFVSSIKCNPRNQFYLIVKSIWIPSMGLPPYCVNPHPCRGPMEGDLTQVLTLNWNEHLFNLWHLVTNLYIGIRTGWGARWLSPPSLFRKVRHNHHHNPFLFCMSRFLMSLAPSHFYFASDAIATY